MTAHYESKHGQVARRKEELFMAFTDMRNFTRMAPEQLQSAGVAASVDADFDNLSVTVQGFRIAVRISERNPYSVIRIISVDSPVEFVGALHFDDSAFAGCTDFHIVLDANMNLMIKTMIGGKVKEALDQIVDSLVAAS